MTHYELAGLTDEAGRLFRSTNYGEWQLPAKVEIKGKKLLWEYKTPPGGKWGPRKEPDPELLEGLLELHDAEDQQIANFARKWGVLEICKHDLPATHNKAHYPFFLDPLGSRSCHPRKVSNGLNWEPIDSWRAFSRVVRSVLNVASRIHQNQLGEQEDWNFLLERLFGGGSLDAGSLDPRTRLRLERRLMAEVINVLVNYSGVRPQLDWGNKRPRLVYVKGSLFGAVVLQLILAVSHTDALFNCSYCQSIYMPEFRKPRAGENNLCVPCKKAGVSQKLASRRYRKKKAGRSKQR